MATTDTNVPQVIVNKLTSAEYATATKSPTEFYAVTDAKVETADIANGAITSDKVAKTSYNFATEESNPGGTNVTSIVAISGIVTVNVGQIWLSSTYNTINANTWITIATLPSALLPSSDMSSVCVLVDGYTGDILEFGRLLITPSGDVRCKFPQTSTTTHLHGVGFSISWTV